MANQSLKKRVGIFSEKSSAAVAHDQLPTRTASSKPATIFEMLQATFIFRLVLATTSHSAQNSTFSSMKTPIAIDIENDLDKSQDRNEPQSSIENPCHWLSRICRRMDDISLSVDVTEEKDRDTPCWIFDILEEMHLNSSSKRATIYSNLACNPQLIAIEPPYYASDIPREFEYCAFPEDSPLSIAVEKMLDEGFNLITGRWEFPGNPQVILLDVVSTKSEYESKLNSFFYNNCLSAARVCWIGQWRD